MSENNEQNPVGEAEQPVAAAPDYKAELELLKAKNQELIAERRADQQRVKDVERMLAERKQAELIQKEDYKTLHSDLEGNYKNLRQEHEALLQTLEQERVGRQQDRIKAQATSLFAQSGVNSPELLMKCIGENLRVDESGAVTILAGGVQVPLAQHLDTLKNPGSGYEMFFPGTGARGMSSVGSTSTSAGSDDLSSMSLTELVRLEQEEPERYALLRASQG